MILANLPIFQKINFKKEIKIKGAKLRSKVDYLIFLKQFLKS